MADISRHISGATHPPDPAWAAWDTAWTRQARTITERADLTVVVAPGAGGGSPACYIPAHARIEIDATYIGSPDIANPARAGHKRTVPAGWGTLLHETAHAAHTRWTPPPGTPPVIGHAATLLEESRCEARHRARRPRDRMFLRHAVRSIVDPGDVPVDDPWHAAALAGLILARVDARILAAKDVKGQRAAVTAILGRKILDRLREIWRTAQQICDDDAASMIGLAEQWCQALGIDPHTQPDIPTADPGAFPGRLADAVADWAATQAGLSREDYLIATAELPAGRPHILARGTVHRAAPAGWSRRDPTPAERAAARRLSARLAAARSSHPQPARAPAGLPPGRLHTQQALHRDAQRAAGTIPTAQPWQRRAPIPPDKPPLRLGVLVDVSGSMRDYMPPLSRTAWLIAQAAHGNQASTATIAFGPATTVVTRPGRRPTQVLDMSAGGGTDTFRPAITIAERLLRLRRPDATRMLVVVSDGLLSDISAGQALISTLHRDGVRILWLHPAGTPAHTFADTDALTITDPAESIAVIATAMTAAIANT